jgi:hypothetical protein
MNISVFVCQRNTVAGSHPVFRFKLLGAVKHTKILLRNILCVS